MASKIRNMAMSFVLLFTLSSLIVSFWTPMVEQYDLTETQLVDNENIFQKLANNNFIQGINKLSEGVVKVAKLGQGGDLLGGIALIGSGTLQTIGGIVTYPLAITNAIFGFYEGYIPAAIAQLLGFLVVLGVSFILLSAKLGFEL